MFRNQKCINFHFQACRGDKYDDGTHLQVKRSRRTVMTDNKKKFFKVPNQADFLIVFSCVPGNWLKHINQACAKIIMHVSASQVTTVGGTISGEAGSFSHCVESLVDTMKT